MLRIRAGSIGRRLAIALVMSSVLIYARADAQEVIVNSNVKEAVLSQNELRAIFSMRVRQWPDGQPIRVFVLPEDSEIHVEFAKRVLNTFPHQLKRTWDSLVFSGTGQSPTRLTSEQDMIKAIARTPGAIGYVSSNYAGEENEHIRVFKVQ